MTRKRDITRSQARAQERRARDAEVKKKAAELKRRGLIYENKDLRKTKVTAYMRKRVAQLEGVLTGELVALTPPKRPSRYKNESGLVATTRKKIVVYNEPDIVQGFRGDRRVRVKPLGDGTTIEMISFPEAKRNIPAIIDEIDDTDFDALKTKREYFAFRFYGGMNAQVFPNASALRFELERYRERTKNPRDNGGQFDELVVYRVYPKGEWEKQLKRERAANREAAIEAKRLARDVRRERRKENRKPRFTPEQIAAAKEAREMMRKEKDRLRKRAKRAAQTDADRARNAARMRAARAKK